MPRLLLLCEYPTLHGGERSMLATLDAVRAAGYHVGVACPAEGALAETLRQRAVEVLPFAARDADGRTRPQPALREDLGRLLDAWRPDLLHANSLAMGRLSGPVAAARRLPSLAHLRDIITLSRQAVADLNCHTRLLAVSQATRDHHAACGLARPRLHVLHNGVDLAQFAPRPRTGDLHRELGLPADAILVGTIGQIGLRKGQDVLLQAAATLAESFPNVHYLIVGQRFSDKDESRQFEADLHTAAARLSGRVHFLGFRNDTERLLAELAMLVHPARQEPLGRVLLEAAATGLAVVATDVGGTREIFPPERDTARLVPPDDAEAMAAAMGALLADAMLRTELGTAARRRAEEAFDIRRAAPALVEHYRAVQGLPERARIESPSPSGRGSG